MKKRFILGLFIIIGLFMITGCENVENDNSNDKKTDDIVLEEKEYALSKNKTIVINSDLSITFESVSDSRCPKDVECFWQGELEYTLLINDNYYKLSTVLNPKINYQKYLISIVSEKCNINNLVFKVE